MHSLWINFQHRLSIGKIALERHFSTAKHTSSVREASGSKTLDKCFASTITKQRAISLAEAGLTFHGVKHHQSFRSSDCSNKLYASTFPDSTTASNIACGRTTTTAIVKEVLKHYSIETYMKDLQSTPFLSVATDGATHQSKLMFPVMVQYFMKDAGIKHFLLNFDSLRNEKSETITNFVMDSLKSKSLESKTIGFSADNTNGNFGPLVEGIKTEVTMFSLIWRVY